MQSREDSLWESFLQALKTCEGAGRYINAFWAPFQGLPPLSHQDVYVLQACSLLVIPPPEGSLAPQGGFLTDIVGINLSDWPPWFKTWQLAFRHCHPTWVVAWVLGW